MKKQAGYLLAATGVAVIAITVNYWRAMSLPAMFFALGVCAVVGGLIIVFKIKLDEFVITEHERIIVPQEQLKSTGLAVRLTLDNCDVKSRSFQQEVIQDSFPTEAEAYDALISPERVYKVESIRQTYVVFEGLFNGVPRKFISHATSMDEVSARMLIDSRGGVLYVDKKNPDNYFFELPF